MGLSACSDDRGAFVLVNTHNIGIEQQLFTLATEIGHLIFHRSDYQDTLIEEGTTSKERSRSSVADYFAKHLLMPQMQLQSVLEPEKVPENERYNRIIFQALSLGKISELKAAELLNIGDPTFPNRSSSSQYSRCYPV